MSWEVTKSVGVAQFRKEKQCHRECQEKVMLKGIASQGIARRSNEKHCKRSQGK
jgi:hypothetical protein